MTWPKVSIVIPSFNQGRFIRRTIRSIQLQDYPGGIEIIVSDDGSTDETVDVLKSLDGINWWSAKDRGFADAVNQGFKAATGEICAIQSSDDFYLQGAFRKAVAALTDHPECVLASGSEVHVDAAGRVVKTEIHESRIIHFPKQIALERYTAQHCTFFRRESFRQIGGVRECVDRCADFDLFYRMLHLGPGITFPDFFAVYQLHPMQRINSQADKWVQATLKSVNDAENDPLLGNCFRLSIEEKRYFEVCQTLHWHSTAGGEEGIKFATDFALSVTSPKSNWPLQAQKKAQRWLATCCPKQTKTSRGTVFARVHERIGGTRRKLKSSLRDLRRKVGLASRRQPSIPDIHWWANAESANRDESRG